MVILPLGRMEEGVILPLGRMEEGVILPLGGDEEGDERLMSTYCPVSL